MKSKNAFWLSLALATILACTPMLAQTSPEDVNPLPKAGAQTSPAPGNGAVKDAQRTISGPYRVTYTLTEMDGTKRVGSQRYEIVLDTETRSARIKLESHVPVSHGPATKPNYYPEVVGITIQAHLSQFANGLELTTDIVGTTFVNEKSESQTTDYKPSITRYASFSNATLMEENKQLILGDLDIPGSTHGLRIQAELTQVR